MSNKKNTNKFNTEMLQLLVCPITKEKLHYDKVTQELISKKAKLAYPIQDGIPIMKPEKARKIIK